MRTEDASEACSSLRVSKAEIRLRTSAFTANGWQGSFYPRGMKSADYLDYYSTRTHTRRLLGCDAEFERFVDTVDVLDEKLGPLLFQFPFFNKDDLGVPIHHEYLAYRNYRELNTCRCGRRVCLPLIGETATEDEYGDTGIRVYARSSTMVLTSTFR